jgi:hypothetical protein
MAALRDIRTSVMRSSGLLGVSIQTSAAGFDSAADTAAAIAEVHELHASSPRFCHAVNRRNVPP